jgi:hypothetical protein
MSAVRRSPTADWLSTMTDSAGRGVAWASVMHPGRVIYKGRGAAPYFVEGHCLLRGRQFRTLRDAQDAVTSNSAVAKVQP